MPIFHSERFSVVLCINMCQERVRDSGVREAIQLCVKESRSSLKLTKAAFLRVRAYSELFAESLSRGLIAEKSNAVTTLTLKQIRMKSTRYFASETNSENAAAVEPHTSDTTNSENATLDRVA